MAFGSTGGFSFGGNNNNSTTPFGGGGGFGASTTNTGGFGQTQATNTGFGASTITANPFSSGNNAFGASNTGGGFGQTQNSTSLFGAKPNPFGASTTTSAAGTGIFGNSTNTNTGFGASNTGGFGAQNNASTGGFGAASNNTGFSFGASKPAFGATNTTSTPLFGQGGQGTTGGFGANNSPFGAGSGTALNQPVPPCEGTAVTPFAPTNEKDPQNSTQTNSYQSIVFQQPYSKYSFEELRNADYNAGRQFGNGNGQAGGFGASTFGGGFGSANSGGFGSNNNTGTGLFGNQQTSASGFGANTSTTGFGSGGLFGNNANKPANGLFGQQSSAATTGGIFGTAGTSTGGFGSGSTGGFGSNNTAGSGLFGNNTNSQQKPGGIFGTNTTANTGAGFSFGGTNNATTTAPSTGLNLFGNNNTQAQQNTNSFGSGFGNQNQSKPTSLFANTGSAFGNSGSQTQNAGLFGSNNNTATTGGNLFGTGNTNTQQNNSLFGNNNSNTSGGLFGTGNNTNNAGNTGGGIFGNSGLSGSGTGNTNGSLFGNNQTNQQQQNQTGLFGGGNTGIFSNSNQQQKSLFGNASSTNQSGGLFGQPNNNNNSLFENSLINSQQGQQQQNGPKHASLLDSNPYGQSSIWTGLPTATPQNSAPLVTPLSAAQRLKDSKSRPPPTLKLNQSRYMTPPRRGGFGFSYSTYGTPNSAASTPGTSTLSSSMYGRSFAGSLGRSMGKSFSATNLRQQFASDGETVLTPGAFAPGSARFSGGSIRRLTIDRSIRQDLFSPRSPAIGAPSQTPNSPITNGNAPASITVSETNNEQTHKLKKRVSFDKDTTGGTSNGGLNAESGALSRIESDDESAVDGQQPRGRRGKPTNGEMEQVRGNELAVVPEDQESNAISNMKLPTDVNPQPDPEPGNYWMKPTRVELMKLPRDKIRSFTGLQVGRRGCGHVTFNGAVDLTSINMDDIFDKIVEIRVRSITVYPEASSKPPKGKGLNVLSTLYIENSWPRARNKPSAATSGPVFDKHIQRLKRMAGTQFLNYDVTTGVWTFKVPHYTRYGLDYDDEDEFGDSMVDLPSGEDEEASVDDMDVETPGESSPEDDTFAFKSQKTVPGGFGRSSIVEYDHDQDQQAIGYGLDHDHSVASEYEESDDDNAIDMAGSFPPPASESHGTPEFALPLKASIRPFGTPGRPLLDLDGDWAEQLQRTISPRKQNRDALRQVQSKVLLDRAYEPIKPQLAATEKAEFKTSIDVMTSLFGKHQARMAKTKAIGKEKQAEEKAGLDFEFPYAKRAKLFDSDTAEMDPHDQMWHDSFKPSWTGKGALVYAEEDEDGSTRVLLEDVVNDGMKTQVPSATLLSIMQHCSVTIQDGVPFITHKDIPFSTLAQTVSTAEFEFGIDNPSNVYGLAHILFDKYEDQFTYGLSPLEQKQFDYQIRRGRLTEFLSKLISSTMADEGQHSEFEQNSTSEERAIRCLARHDIFGACNTLKASKDNHLALLVSQIDTADETFQVDMTSQINDWKTQNIISEMSEPVRALYEILSGSTSLCEGKATGPLEDRASTFFISERFELDWLEAFGLSLWFGKAKNGSIEESVIEFVRKIQSGEEALSPSYENGKESVLWTLLKLYASKTGAMERPLLPQALTFSGLASRPLDSYGCFAVYHSLVARLSSKGQVAVDDVSADRLASDLAFELSAGAEKGGEVDGVIGAAYALLHIKNSATRELNVKDLLSRFGKWLPEPVGPHNLDEVSHRHWIILTTQLSIPEQWLYEAKALYARSMHASNTELGYLVEAERWEDAHECLCKRVAPVMVIDGDWEGLEDVLAKFADFSEAAVPDWASGGGVYVEFVRAISARTRGQEGNLRGLQAALVEIAKKVKSQGRIGEKDGIDQLRERVAVQEMSCGVAEMLGERYAAAAMALPLTADVRLEETRGLSVQYYRRVMAAAK